jgi:hypothetical protein
MEKMIFITTIITIIITIIITMIITMMDITKLALRNAAGA